MPKTIFISHASADRVLVEPFVSEIIQLGCGVPASDVFYSSGADTGVPDGEDLFAHVRREVGSATLVVAIITQMYLSRPVCMAELGAAWGRSDTLFPLLAPGMKRGDLEGVLPSMLIRYVDDRDALAALHDKVGAATGKPSKTATWIRHSTRWLAEVTQLADALQKPQIASIAEIEDLKTQLKATESAVIDQEDEIRTLNEQLAAVIKLKDKAEVTPLLTPRDQQERLDALVGEARDALKKVQPPIVREAIRCEFAGVVFSYQSEDWESREVHQALDDGFLVDTVVRGEETVAPDPQFPLFRKATQAIEKLTKFIEEDAEPELIEAFEMEHQMPLDLRKRAAWNELLT